jgi:penicillin amidase
VIVTANNRVVADDYPHFVSAEWLNPYRAERIAELLAARERHSVADCCELQVDVRSLPGLRLQALLGDLTSTEPLEQRSLELLRAWDGELTTGSAGGAIYAAFLRHLTFELYAEVGEEIDRFLGSAGFSQLSSFLPFYGRATPVVLDLLEARDDGFFRDGRTWRGVLAKTLTRTSRELAVRLGDVPDAWRHGDAHVLRLDHPLAAVPGLARLFRRGPYPLPGDADTVWQAWQPPSDPSSGLLTTGPSMRLVVDLGDPDGTRFVLCGGQSGHPASPAYDDQLPDWLAGRTRPLAWSDAAIERERASTLTLSPA